MKTRCSWCNEDDALMIAYHDKEWGVPLHDDDKLFELLILEGAQAGLSWSTILKRRENYRIAFDHFNAKKIARYTPQKIEKLLNNSGIIRNRLKILSTISNAKAFLKIKEEHKNFDQYIWQFVNGRPKINPRKKHQSRLTHSPESDAMSKDLKKRGFSFVGTTICYAFMQAVGMVNDHETACFRFREIEKINNK